MSAPEPPIEEYMTRSPHAVGADQTVGSARQLMRAHRIRHLPVLQAGRLVGVLSERELHWIHTLKGGEGDSLRVEEVMSSLPCAVAPGAPLGQVAREMAEHKHDVAVVMDHDQVVGLFTTTDALSALAALLAAGSVAGRAG